MSKTRKNITGTQCLIKGWSKQQAGAHQRTIMMKKCGKNAFLDLKKLFQFVQKIHVK